MGEYITKEESDHYAELEPQQFVSKFFEMDPKTEDLLKSGDLLKNGMIVLIENEGFRVDVENFASPASPADLYSARTMNRWCTVSEVEVEPRDAYQVRGSVTFIGTYPDGTKRTRKCTLANGWYVKKSSIPDDLATASEKNLPMVGGDDYNYGEHLDQHSGHVTSSHSRTV